MRPVFNRPEMLKLSLEYEEHARSHSDLADDFVTVFLIEHGAPEETLQLLRDYPYEKIGIKRGKKYGLSVNILTGMQVAFERADDYIIYIEDDVLVHSTYFNYLKKLLEMFKEERFSILASFNKGKGGDVNEVYRGHAYAALAPLISKYFFEKYIDPCISPAYYRNFGTRSKFVVELNAKYKKYWGGKYKYRDAQHNEQAGLINRLVDVALIEEDMYVITPRVDRNIHIGYYGKNRPGGKLPGKTFDERVENLQQIILSADKMYQMSATKQYNDYRVFDPRLKDWDGTLYVK
jgi:hypothetical protein